MRRTVSMAICCACFLSSTVAAGIVRVPADSPTIQGGIQLAASGDTVLVDQGLYLETLVISNPVVLLSEYGPESTIVDAGGEPTHVILVEEDADGSIIEGFTIRGADGGAGIIVDGALQTAIRSNIVEDNVSSGTAGIGLFPAGLGSPSLIEGNVIRGNRGGKSVAGIRAENADVRDNWIEGNLGSETAYLVHCTFTGNIVVGNSANWTLRLTFVNCLNNTIANNEGGGVLVLESVLERNILAHDLSNVALECVGPQVAASCNVFWGEASPLGDDCAFLIGENDNVFADPLFCDAENGDYRLAANSPAAVGSCGLVGALPVGCGVAGVLAGEGAPPAVPSLRAYPNPARASVSFELSGAASGRVHIFDVGGRLVDTVLLRSGRANWDAREVPAGVYWLRVDGAIGAEARLVLAH